MHRIVAVLLVTLLLSLTSAWGQVAAPTLLPDFVPGNPAVIQWSEKSHIGGAWFEGDSDITDSSTVPPTLTQGDSSGQLVGLRLTGEYISFAAQVATLEGSEGTTISSEFDISSVALAIPIGDALALGIGQEQVDIRFVFDDGALRAERNLESTLPMVGLSLRLGSVLYLGAAVGTEDATASQATVPFIPPSNFDVAYERDVARYGVAIHDETGVKWHLEYSVNTMDSTTDPATGLTIQQSEETTAIVELNAGGYHLGFRAKELEETDDSTSPTVVDVTETTREVNLGWVPEKGWALILVASTGTREEPATQKTDESETLALLLSFLF